MFTIYHAAVVREIYAQNYLTKTYDTIVKVTKLKDILVYVRIYRWKTETDVVKFTEMRESYGFRALTGHVAICSNFGKSVLPKSVAMNLSKGH